MAKEKKVASIVPPELTPQEPPALPQDLLDQLNSIRALAATLNLLAPFAQAAACINFQNTLYEQVVDAALKHPQSHLSPDLEHLRKVRKVVDGNAPTLEDADKVIEAERKREKRSKLKVVPMKKGKK